MLGRALLPGLLAPSYRGFLTHKSFDLAVPAKARVLQNAWACPTSWIACAFIRRLSHSEIVLSCSAR
eukprot:scaffold159510_cov16-Tisochrysis_lutea.AAC.1